MRYLQARLDDYLRVRGYRYYVTDALKVALVPSAARYADLFDAKEDPRTGDEIINNISEKLGALDDGSV